MLEIVYKTPLSICVNAGRTCWESHEKGGCYMTPTDNIDDVDKEFLYRILKKHKHGSVAEHIRIIFKTTDTELVSFIKLNPFIKTSSSSQTEWFISTNLRAILEMPHNNTKDMMIDLLGETYNFLFTNEEIE